MKIASVIACIPLMAGVVLAQTPSDRQPGEGGEGVTVKLLPPSPGTHEPLRYVLSEPAYIAAFIVYPGAGVRLLYPTVNIPERIHRSGYNTDQLIGANFDGDAYNVVLGPRMSGPAYLYLIASRNPLDVARYVHKPMTLAAAVGEQASRSFYNDVAFDALLNNAIALGDDASWDSDVYMLWSNPGASGRLADGMLPTEPQSLYTSLHCADGTSRYVPVNYPFIGCPGEPHIRPSTAAAQPPQQSASAELRSGSSAQVATVLPTIIGPRPTAADRAAMQQRAAPQRLLYTTVANGDQQTGVQRSEPAASATEAQIIAVRQRDLRADRDALHGRHAPEEGGYGERSATRYMNGQVVGRAPQLSPNPSLAPDPGLSPAPGISQNAAQHFEVPRERPSAPPTANQGSSMETAGYRPPARVQPQR